MGGLALFETRVTRLPSSVNAAPPVLWTSAGATVFTAQGVGLFGALGNDVSNPPGSRRTCCSRSPAASKRLTRGLLTRKPFPRWASPLSSPQRPGGGTAGAPVLLWCMPVDF